MRKFVHVNNPKKGQKGFQPIPLAQRFWAKVEKTETCWFWRGWVNHDGYGNCPNKKGEGATHRISYEFAFGKIPSGMSVLHRCDNPSCVNPAHLWIGTQGDNIRDMAEKGRIRPRGFTLVRQRLDILEVFRLRAEGMSQKAIADKLGVHQPSICKILKTKAGNEGWSRTGGGLASILGAKPPWERVSYYRTILEC